MPPLVSVIIPTKNSSRTLEKCLESVKNQSYKNIELIVVDNNSTDNTKDIARKYTDKVFNYGPERSAQRNYGVEQSIGEFVAIIDSDMKLSPKVIETCVQNIESDTKTVGIIIPEESFGEGFWAQCKKLERSFYIGVSYMEAARFFRKDAYVQAGGYDENMVSGEDWDLSQRIEKQGVFGRTNEFIFHNEGKISLYKTIKKKFYYAQKFSKYVEKSRDDEIVKSQTSILKRYWLFFSQPVKLFRNPFFGLGMLFMKTCEFGFGGIGYLVGKFGIRVMTGKKNKEADCNCLITIIMPIFNGASTLEDALVSLEKQEDKDLIKELIFINDNSTDNSREIIEKYQQKSAYTTRLVNNKTNEGLARNYNKGIDACSSDYFILMHQDVVLLENNCFKNIIVPFSDNNVIAVFSGLLHPFSVWQKYNFYQKCLFSRFVGKTIFDLNGKFDCYDRKKLIEHIGLFDEKIFRTAGEDSDMKRRIDKNGFKVVYSGFNVVHLHNKETNFDYKKIFKKEAQIAEAQGVLLRLYGINNIKDFLMSFFRPILLLSLFIPRVNILSLFLIIMYAFYYTWLVYIKEWKNFRILILPFINLCILPVATFYSIKGFLLKTQKI